MSRQPTVGGDSNAWGSVLDDYLNVEHNTDGTHKKGTGSYVTPTGVRGAVPRAYAIPAVYSHIGTGTLLALNYAKARGFVGVSLNDFADHLLSGAQLPPKPLLLSFDDEATQWTSVIDPILQTFGWRATGSISSGYPDGEVMTGGTDPFFYTNTSPSTWAQISALGGTGRWDFANHTRTHPDLTGMTTVQRNAEWSYSQGRIQTMLGTTPRVFVHPRDADNLDTVRDAFAFGFQLVTVGPQGYDVGNPIYGPGSKQMANPAFPNYPGGFVIWRDAPDSVQSIEDVYEPFGNRIPDMPMTVGDPYTVWTVTAGVRGSASNGVRFSPATFPATGEIDIRSNGTGTVSAATSQYIAVKPGEILRFAYFRQCGVTGGTYLIQVQEFDSYRTNLRTNTFESNTGTVSLALKEAAYTVGTDAYFVKLLLSMNSAPSGSFATFELPFFGSTR
jgi:peptidoglycan/xylan/chitin deacetylase (PgdA/CDA1 family)